jgi:hypothetical protein
MGDQYRERDFDGDAIVCVAKQSRAIVGLLMLGDQSVEGAMRH